MSLILVLTLATASATPAGWGLDRVDVVAELPGTFVNDDLPQTAVDPVSTTVRFVEQVQVVFTTPIEGLTLGASIAAQSLFYAVPIAEGFELQLGLQTRALLPVGVGAAIGWRAGWLRVGAGVVAGTTASWARVDYDHPYVLPTLALGILTPVTF